MAGEIVTVVTDRAVNTDARMAQTIFRYMQPWKIVAVRACRVYLQSLTGLLAAFTTGAAGAVGVNMPAGDFWSVLASCASLAVAPTVMSMLLNMLELFNKWDETVPQWRA